MIDRYPYAGSPCHGNTMEHHVLLKFRGRVDDRDVSASVSAVVHHHAPKFAFGHQVIDDALNMVKADVVGRQFFRMFDGLFSSIDVRPVNGFLLSSMMEEMLVSAEILRCNQAEPDDENYLQFSPPQQ